MADTAILDSVFDPSVYSIPEAQFLIDHLGEPPQIAARSIPALVPVTVPAPDGKSMITSWTCPSGIVPASVMPALERIYQLAENERYTGEKWVGVDAIKAGLQLFIDQSAKWEKDAKRGAPRFPSMHSFDSRNRPHRGGPGSDTGQVRTYFDGDGNRKPFQIFLYGDEEGWKPDWAHKRAGTDMPAHVAGLHVNHEARRFECFCGHTEHYKSDSQGSFNAARGRIAKHLVKATDDVERHREIYTAEFGS